jgi:peroxiredoxin
VLEQKFVMNTDLSNPIEKMSVRGSQEANEYYEYLRANAKLQREHQQTEVQEQKQNIYKQFKQLAKDYIEKHPNSFTGNIIKANQAPETPLLHAKSTKKDTADYVKFYYHHIFDNIDLSDDRLIRTSILDKFFDTYLQEIAYNNSPDEIIALAEKLINRTKPKSELRKFVVVKFASKFISPEVLGTDKVYTEITKKYIISEPENFDENTIRRNLQYVNRMESTMIDKILPDMCLTDTLNKATNLWDIESKYTMVVIYDYGCSHCQEFTKKLVEYYPKLEKLGMKVYMVCKIPDHENWLKFIENYGTHAFTNVINRTQKVDFDNIYNASLVPKVFLLDKNKKIMSNLTLEMANYEQMMSKK